MNLKLTLLPEIFSICRLKLDDPVPDKILDSSFFTITRTEDELSLVCLQKYLPENAVSNNNWRCFKVDGPLDFSLTGIISSLTLPLAKAEIPVFVFSTYDTDYLMVKRENIQKAIKEFSKADFIVSELKGRLI